jgi:hypothetical protein
MSLTDARDPKRLRCSKGADADAARVREPRHVQGFPASLRRTCSLKTPAMPLGAVSLGNPAA